MVRRSIAAAESAVVVVASMPSSTRLVVPAGTTDGPIVQGVVVVVVGEEEGGSAGTISQQCRRLHPANKGKRTGSDISEGSCLSWAKRATFIHLRICSRWHDGCRNELKKVSIL